VSVSTAPGRPRRRLHGFAVPVRAVGAASVIVLVAFLLPVVHAPFFSDDITFSEVVGYRKLHDESLLGLFGRIVWDFVVHGGRPQIFSGFPGYPLFNLLGDHPAAYHAVILGFTALDAALLYALLRRLRAPVAAAALVVVLAGAWMQLRIYHDSMVSFAGLVQVVLACVIGSLWFFARWLDEGRRGDMVWAVVLLFVACGTYEVAYSLSAAHVALAFSRRRGRDAVRAAAPFVGVSLFFALATLAGRHFADSVAVGYSVGGGGPWTILRTYAIQLISPLPTMSLTVDPGLGGDPTTGEWLASLWRGMAAAVLVGGLAVALARASAVRWGAIVAVGLALYLAPPVLLSVAGKYQHELSTGIAYLPVLIQVFALAILATAALGGLLRLAAARSRAMLTLVIAAAAAFAGITAGVTAFNNIRVVAMLQPDRASRELVEHAAARGAFDRVPAGASVFFPNSDLYWEGPTPYQGYLYAPLMLADKTGRVYDARMVAQGFAAGSCARTADVVQPECAPPAASAAWARVRLRHDGGTVVVAPIPHPAQKTFPAAPATELTVYRESAGGGAPPPPRLIGVQRNGAPWSSDGAQWRRVDGGDDWSLWRVTLDRPGRPGVSSVDDDHGFVNFFAMPPPPQRVRLLGTRELLP
jgi:hypothetical protein